MVFHGLVNWNGHALNDCWKYLPSEKGVYSKKKKKKKKEKKKERKEKKERKKEFVVTGIECFPFSANAFSKGALQESKQEVTEFVFRAQMAKGLHYENTPILIILPPKQTWKI